MNFLRPQIALVALALAAMPLIGCSGSSSSGDDSSAPAPASTGAAAPGGNGAPAARSEPAAAPDLDAKEVAREVGLNGTQEAKLVDMLKARPGGGKWNGGGKRGGGEKFIERRVKKMTELLSLTPEQAEKLRGYLKAKAARRGAKGQGA